MKILLEDLIPDRYYISYRNINDNHFYFKYKKHNFLNVFYHYAFVKDTNGDCCNFAANTFTINWYKDVCIFLEEVRFEDIIQFLPESNLDKKAYYRCLKINFLLKETI